MCWKYTNHLYDWEIKHFVAQRDFVLALDSHSQICQQTTALLKFKIIMRDVLRACKQCKNTRLVIVILYYLITV